MSTEHGGPRPWKLPTELPAPLVIPRVPVEVHWTRGYDLSSWGPTARKLPLVKTEYGGHRQVARTAQQLNGDRS